MTQQLVMLVALGVMLTTGSVSARQGATVTGTVSYLQRSALPPEAEITVRLVDVSRADAPATELSSQTFTAGGNQVPFPFTLTYDPAAIDQRYSYNVEAEIRVDGQLRFRNTQAYPVITRGNPTTVDVLVEPVSGGTPSEGGSPTQLPATGAPGDGWLSLLALAATSALAGLALKRRAEETKTRA